MVAVLIIVAGTFLVMFANIWRHARKETDSSGVAIAQNFAIALVGCGVLFWHWGFFDDLAQRVAASSVDCDSEVQRREVRALQICMSSEGCDTSSQDALRIVAYQEECAVPEIAESWAEG